MHNNLQIAFFSEAGTKRGLGHLIRSYTIYKKLQAYSFVSATFYLDSDIDFREKFTDIVPFSWKDFSLKGSYDAVVIDSYEASLEIYKIIAKSAKTAFYIDDYKRLDYPKGVIVNFSPDAKKFYTKDSCHKYLLGTKYIPIRDILKEVKKKAIKKEQLFIMLGGFDTANLSVKIAESLENILIDKLIVTNKKEDIEKLSAIPNSTILYKPTDLQLATAMAESKLAISTASMTLYELNYLEIPTLILAVAQNQEYGAQALVSSHLALRAFNCFEESFLKELQEEVLMLLKDKTIQKPPRNVDGMGTQRIIDTILELSR